MPPPTPVEWEEVGMPKKICLEPGLAELFAQANNAIEMQGDFALCKRKQTS